MSERGNHPRIEEVFRDQSLHQDHEKLIHDLRNSLSSILMQAHLLSRYAENPVADADAIKRSASALERDVRAMDSLLDAA